MKKSHIFGIVVIAAAIAIIISTAGDASSYVTFKEAENMDRSVHVVGQLKKDDAGHFIEIYESDDKLTCTFSLIDSNGETETVFYNEPMPPDLLRSEQVVVIGKFKEDVFYAEKILLKCPSKYQEGEVKA